MSLLKRFNRALKGLFGGAVSAMEDPKLILEQNIREMNDQVPKMNESIATVKANVSLLEKELDKYKKEYSELSSKIKAAINQNRDDIASNYALRLEKLKGNIEQTENELEAAKAAYDKALEVKKAFMREREQKIQQAQEAMRAHERSEWQSTIADTMEQFETGGIDQTHDEMVSRLDQKTAHNEARVDLAMESIDTSGMKVDEEAEQLRAQDLVTQFKQDMAKGEAEKEGAEETETDPEKATETDPEKADAQQLVERYKMDMGKESGEDESERGSESQQQS